MDELQELKKQVALLQEQVAALKEMRIMNVLEVNELTINRTMKMGDGDIAMHMDKEGIWFGSKRFADVVAGTAVPSTGIAMDGTFYQN